jgi:hypothetical protein
MMYSRPVNAGIRSFTMTQVVRKQIYIEPHQEALLKRLAQALGVSEAELIRKAIEGQLRGGRQTPLPPDPAAWEKALQFMLDLHDRGPVVDRGRTWERENLYEERLSRHDRNSD